MKEQQPLIPNNEKNRVAFLSVVAAIFLTSFKIVIGLLTGSLGILSEALHSALDLIAAAITWFAVRLSDKPADRDHHYGHGKIENLSAFVETMLLLVTCIWIIYEATGRLISGNTHIKVTVWSYVVVITSIIIDISRSRALMKVAKKHNSQALEADALHFSTDVWSSSVVLLGLIVANFGIYWADSIAALMVAMIVIYVSYNLGKRSINVLLDRVPDDIYKKIKELVFNFEGIVCYHDLKVRAAGADIFVEVNIHVESNLDIQQSHKIATQFEEKIKAEIPRCHIHVHMEPNEEEDSD
ncbi:MAG TPA: cation transporter [Marinilabiliales bacterium]|nr:MAG: cation transporter [Bacteroidetes bacterium GWA2_40_14]OFX72727.1 MAG: cation transporter [Bacteroidetes bacterium GWD2_40_43]OFX91357.1 MAG: cation transporter [Bacteroidetes bacterium GWE2_40_63]OFY19427.1 MAG: cation transporter [Bacteroidetes bacterium GWF2_40_13]OFZ25577.1 MAG: cation transporter [Bacteroidetes bacterium RIFOXYC2_FULL_40_12]HAM97779.1 cation transporter [Marinilabiliales bacterium]